MRKRLAAWAFALFGAFALAVSCSVHPPVGFRAQADIPFYHYSKTFTTTGNLPTINLTGQSSCVYTITGTGTATPKGSSDGGVTYATISNAGFGAITSGIAGGALIPASGTPVATNFYVAVTGVTGSATATETCSSQVARVSSSGGGGGGVTSLVPGICTSPDPAVGNATLDYICGTPQPLGPGTCTSPAPTDMPAGGVRIDYTCHTPAPQDTTAPTIAATACGAPPSINPAYPFIFSVPAGCQSSPVPSPLVTSTPCAQPPAVSGATIEIPWPCTAATPTTNPYDATILAETSATHYWKLNDAPAGATPGPCPTSAVDSISGGATAGPSPVPLPIATGAPQCGAVGLLPNDTGTSTRFGQTLGSPDGFSVPTAVFETLCKVGGGACNLSFSIECIIWGTLSAANINEAYLGIDNTTGLELYLSSSGTYSARTAGSAHGISQFSGQMPQDVVYIFNGTNSLVYFNGQLVANAAWVPSIANAVNGSVGYSSVGFWAGRVEKCSTYNTALTLQQVNVHYKASGLP